MGDASLDADRIRAASFIRHVEIHDTLGSTNDRAADLACDALTELPALVVARNQTAGRGRGDKSWWSTDGALTFSVLLAPATIGISPVNWPQLSLATAVAVCDALSEELAANVQRAETANVHPNLPSRLGIKWPNDVMLDDCKVCGILIESPGGVIARDRLVVGVGVNVNNSFLDSPRKLASQGIALCDASGNRHSLPRILLLILNSLEQRAYQLANGDVRLRQDWHQLCWLRSKAICVDTDRRRVEGICGGITADGALLVNTSTAAEHIFSGSVSLAKTLD